MLSYAPSSFTNAIQQARKVTRQLQPETTTRVSTQIPAMDIGTRVLFVTLRSIPPPTHQTQWWTVIMDDGINANYIYFLKRF
mmetsp:Transcript_18977/g.41131  ORF Transcript_18977/g.41131 Transcript_18977/m.41131 type:complete len:82 (+) Transcript_18977:491-736(+)